MMSKNENIQLSVYKLLVRYMGHTSAKTKQHILMYVNCNRLETLETVGVAFASFGEDLPASPTPQPFTFYCISCHCHVMQAYRTTALACCTTAPRCCMLHTVPHAAPYTLCAMLHVACCTLHLGRMAPIRVRVRVRVRPCTRGGWLPKYTCMRV